MLNKKIPLILSILLLLFASVIFTHGSSQTLNPEITMLSDSNDFNIINTDIDNYSYESEVGFENLDGKEKIKEISFLETGALNVYKWPSLRPEAKISNHYLQGYQCSEWFLNSKKNNFTLI